MTLKLEHKLALIGVATAAVAGFVYSQIYFHQKSREEIEEIAAELALTWKFQLGLSEEQTMELQDTIVEYTIKKNEIINSPLSHNSQIAKLKNIQKNEHKSVSKIMTDEQFDNYLNTNKKLTRKV